MKKKFLKYFIMCTAVIFFMTSASVRVLASEYDIPVWSSQNNKISDVNAENKTENEAANKNNTVNPNKAKNDVVNTNANAGAKEVLDSSQAITNNPLKLTSGGAILIEQSTGNVLYSYNMHEKLRPASVTKIMTILLIMEAIDGGRISLTDKVG